MKKGFTIIELLVVFSILSLLASIILVATSSTRDSAKVATGRQFEAQVYHGIGDTLIGWWNFDDCSGVTAKDSSGFSNNDGTLTNGPLWSTDTPTKSGCSISFDGIDDYLKINGVSGNFASRFQGIHGPSTLSLWFKANSFLSGSRDIFSDNCLEWGFYLNNQNLYGSVYNGINAGPVEAGKWYHVVVTHDFNNTYPNTIAKLYMNGQFKGQTNVVITAGNNGYNDAPYYVGADGCYTANNFNGLVDDIRAYSTAVTAQEVGRIYAEGKRKINLAAQ